MVPFEDTRGDAERAATKLCVHFHVAAVLPAGMCLVGVCVCMCVLVCVGVCW